MLLEYVLTFDKELGQKWTTSNYYGENGSMMQQHEIMELKNPKVTGDLAITYLKVPNN